MNRSTALLTFLFAAALTVPQAAAADTGAVCALSFRVHFEPSGQIVQDGPGSGSCAGTIGRILLDPFAQPAVVRGQAHRGTTACAPRLTAGSLTLPLRRPIDFRPRQDDELSALWTGSSYVGGLPVLGGRGNAMGRTVRLTGTIRFLPAARCALRGFTPGTIQMEALVEEARAR